MNYYEVFSLEKYIVPNLDALRKSYYIMAREYHPDSRENRNLNPEQKKIVEEKFKLLTAAYETLKDQEKKNIYDAQLKAEEAERDRSSTTNNFKKENSDQHQTPSNTQWNEPDIDLEQAKQIFKLIEVALEMYFSKASRLVDFASQGDWNSVYEIAEENVTVNAVSPSTGMRPIHYAIIGDNLEVCKYLVSRGAWLSRGKDKEGNTPLCTAILNDKKDIAQYFIYETKININSKNGENYTALDLALCRGHYEIAQILLEQGAKVFDNTLVHRPNPNLNFTIKHLLDLNYEPRKSCIIM